MFCRSLLLHRKRRQNIRCNGLQLFRKLETVMAYLKGLGIHRFDVDASGYDGRRGQGPLQAPRPRRGAQAGA